MQVRKFEAKTIKDAIDLVKYHLGPDAIILSAKENAKGFGLMGDASVEVTAAVSESKLRKKQLAERKLDPRSMQRYSTASARIQKRFIDKAFESDRLDAQFAESSGDSADQSSPEYVSFDSSLPSRPKKAQPRRHSMTSAQYSSIGEDGEILEQVTVPVAPPIQAKVIPNPTAPQFTPPPKIVPQSNVESEKVASLQKEISNLRSLLSHFQRVPQNFVSLHPGADSGLPYELSFSYKRLQDAGMSDVNITEILKLANEVLPIEQKKKKAFVDGWVLKYLLDNIAIVEKPFATKTHIFVGPTGQGKTSTVIKMACHLIMQHKKKVALISGDHIKVGAKDQFKIYAQILNAPYASINHTSDWNLLEPALQNVDYVFVDTPGTNLRNTSDVDALQAVLPPNLRNAQIHYVQSIMARDVDAFEVADRFKIFGFQDIIFTRLDEAVQYGLIYNFAKRFQVPLHSFGTGVAIPEDFELASKERFVDLIFNLSKFRKERG